MLSIVKKIIPAIALMVVANYAMAQRNAHFVSGSFSEKSLAELRLVQVVNDKSHPIAEYQISPDNSNFVISIPTDTGVSYRLQVNMMKKEGRHAKLERAFTLPLSLNPEQNYTLKITPSKLNDAKKTGWELKQDMAKSTVAFISGKVNIATRSSGLDISLQNVKDGAMVSYNSVKSNNDGSFEIPCQVKQEGFYYLSSMRWRVRVYLKPADRLQVDVDHKTGRPVTLNGSRENQILYQWQQLISPITAYGYNLSTVSTDSVDMDEYIRRYESLQPLMTDFFSKASKANPQFIKAFKNAMDVDRQFAPIHFLLYKSVKKTKGYQGTPRDFYEPPAFSKQLIQPGIFSKASILQVGETRQLMNLYARLNIALLPTEKREQLSPAEKLQLMMKTIFQ
jgi:hypothetical protein